MRYYLRLQVIRLGRFFSDQGLHPLLGVLLLSGFFIGSGLYLYHQFEFAGWFIVVTAGSTLLRSSHPNRTDFLNSLFHDRVIQRIRLLEQLLVASPFALFLATQEDYTLSLVVFLMAVATTFVTITPLSNKVLPTPFRNRPFEYIVGFRKTVFILPLSALILFISWKVQNENLAVASIAFMTFVAVSFSSKPEPPEYIWVHSKSTKQFLLHKLKTAVLNAQVLILPCTFAAILLFPNFWMILVLAHLVSTLFIGILVFAKYAAYPNEIGVAQAILLGLCLWFPPLLVVVLPKFFFDGRKRLTVLLHD